MARERLSMPQWSLSIDGVIVIYPTVSATVTTPLPPSDQDASFMATLARLGRAPIPRWPPSPHPQAPATVAHHRDSHVERPPLHQRATDSIVTADLPQLAEQLDAAARVLRHLVDQDEGTTRMGPRPAGES
jgi:hypothetical protein